MDTQNLDSIPAFETKDGSEIRELLAYRNSAIRNQSLAEARVPVGGSTMEHYHVKTEEIYFITHGAGRMRIDGEERPVRVGDRIRVWPAHVDPTVAYHEHLHVVDGEQVLERWEIDLRGW